MTVKKRFISSFAHRTLVSRQSLFSPRSPALPDSWEKKKQIPSMKILLSCSYFNGQGFINFSGNSLNWILGMEIISGISEMIVY